MMKKMRMVFLVVGIVLFHGFITTSSAAEKYDIRMGTSPVGGVWAALGNAMLEDIIKANPARLGGATVPMGGAANIIAVYQGKINLAFSFSDALGDAWEAKEDFKDLGKLTNLRVLASVFPEPTQFVVYADSDITTVPQLKGKRITPGPKGSAIEIVTRRIFEAYGMSTKDVQWKPLNQAEAAEQMLDRHLDAICFGAMTYPAPAIVNISSQRAVRLLSLTDEIIDKLVKTHKGLEPFTLAPGSYKGVDYPVKGVSATVILIARQDMPEEVAYAIVRSISENFDRYSIVSKAMGMWKANEMARDVGFPHHPGATKYYKEKGLMK
jgi:uncharacterized protein